MNKTNNKKYTPLTPPELQKILGGKWVSKTELRGDCTESYPWGGCAKMRIYTVTFEENSRTGKIRNETTDVYKT
jgi:hypothetical protein